MNPLEGCFKGYKKCVKRCCHRDRCRICASFSRCCRLFCSHPAVRPEITNEELDLIRRSAKPVRRG